jgi:hypothetical protein
MLKPYYLLCFLLCGLGAAAQIQNPPDLEALLQNQRNYGVIVNTVQQYYAAKKNTLQSGDSLQMKRINRQLRMWTRWEKFNQARLDEKGDIVNVNQRNWHLYQQMGASAPNGVETSYGVWSEIGPKSYTRVGSGHNGGLGRVNCIGFHPTNASILYVGCPAGGLWKTTNGGGSWTNIADHIPSVGVSGIVVSFNNANTIYILTGDGDGADRNCIGVLKSTDGGANWAATGSFPGTPVAGFRGYKLVQHPTNAAILFAVTDYGIYKTVNSGSIWTQEQTGWFTDIEFKPGDPTIMYAARLNSSTPFYRSTNTGDTWSTAGITDVPTNASRIAIGVSANNPGYVYLLAGPATAVGAYVGVYRSFDSGLDFDLRNSAPNVLGYEINGLDDSHQTTYDLAIEVNPASVATVITGGINLWRSTNFGVNFANATEWFEDGAPVSKYVHADIHNLAYNPLNNRLYVCSDGGVSYSDDNGVNWTQTWNSLQIAQYYKMSGYAPDQNRLIGGLQDNGTMLKKTASTNFDHIEGADGYSAIIDFSNSNILYFNVNSGLNKSTDGGASAGGLALPGSCWPTLAQHITNSSIIFAGRCGGVYKSTNGGGSWTNTGAAGSTELITCPSNNQRVYAVEGNSAYRSDDEAATWVNISAATPNSVTDITVAPFNSLNVWVAVGGYTAGSKVFQSVDGGATWTNRSGSLPNAAATAIAVDNAGGVYVGTDVGVFYREPGSGNWLPFYNWLPKTPITDIVLNETAGTISVSTYGRGLWRTDLYSACTASIVLSGAVSGTRFYEASDNIVTTHVLEGGTGTEFIYRAGNYVRMDPGFEVKTGNNAKAFIGLCATGIPSFSRLSEQYGVKSKTDIIKQELTPLPAGAAKAAATPLTMLPGANGETEIIIATDKDQYVQLYYEAADHEILAFLVKQPLQKGQYSIKVNQNIFTAKGPVTLKLRMGDAEKTISL